MTTGLSSNPMVPWCLALPLTAAVLVLLAGYAMSLMGSDMPPKRRRIRLANTILMMLATPVAAYAAGIVAPSNARLFLLAWLAVTGLLGIMVLLAGMDAAHSIRLHREQRMAVRRALRASLGAAVTGKGAGSDPAGHG